MVIYMTKKLYKIKIDSKYKGILFMVLSAFCFALMSMFVRLSGDLPSIQKSFFRNLVALIFAVILLKKNGDSFSGKRQNIKFLVIRATAGTMGILCNFYAVDNLVLADASILNKMSPFFAIIFSFFVLHEKVKLPQIGILMGAFFGALLILKPGGESLISIPALVGLIGGMMAGLAYTYVRKLGENGEKGAFVVAFFSGFSCLVTLPFLIFSYHAMTAWQIVSLLLAGLAAAGGQFSITTAYFHAPAREISVYDYSQIIFSAALGFVVFGQIPDIYSIAGYIVICLMAVLMFFYNNKQ